MANTSISMRIPVALILILVWTISFMQPGTAQVLQTGPLEPEFPATEPSLWATPLELDFGPVGVGEMSVTQTVAVKNIGDALLANFTGGNVPLPLHVANNCAAGVQPDTSCQYSFWVTPSSAGDLNTTTTINTNAGPFTVKLKARGVSPEFSVSPLVIDFGPVVPTIKEETEDSSVVQQIVVVRNIGLAALSGFSGGNVSAPFTVADDCPTNLLPGEECRYYYNFLPTQAGTFNAASTVNTNGGAFTINMTGKGQSLPFSGQHVTPLDIDFGPVGINNPGINQDVSLNNLDISNPITGFDISVIGIPFSHSQDCTPSVDPGGFCTYTYFFAPLAPGSYITTSTTTNSAGTFSVTLRGTGVRPELSASPLVLDFGPVENGTTSDPQKVIVKNTGKSTVTKIDTVNVDSPFSGSQNCAGGLVPGATCELTFYYSPTSGAYTETTTTVTTKDMDGSIGIKLMGGVKPIELTKQFIPDTIPAGGVSTLQLKIHNPNLATTLFSIALTDNFPAGMVIASPLYFNWSPECGTPTFIPTAGNGTFSLSDGTILGGKTCQIQINVTAPVPKDYVNTIEQVSSKYGPGEAATATLKVRILNYIPYVSN